MQWLVSDVKPGDSLFFHYSGHGSQVIDTSGDEEDGLDETICPVDFKSAGQIIDDDINDLLVKTIPEGARLTALMDCCHSGTGMDLPYMYRSSKNGLVDTTPRSFSLFRKRRSARPPPGSSSGEVILFSGCRDDQTSADTGLKATAGGAMTNAFLEALDRAPNGNYVQLLWEMRESLRNGVFVQIPQLSCGKQMDLNQQFYV